MFSLNNFWSKIILGVCLVAILNFAVLVPVTEATLPVVDWVKNGFDLTWKGIKTAWHQVDSHARMVTSLNSTWEKTEKIRKAAANAALQITLTTLLSKVTNDIVNWIKYGQKPRFITEGPWTYLKNVTDNALGYFVDQYLGAGYLCKPFALDLKIVYSAPPTFEEGSSRCTISDMGKNLGSFLNDFRSGGWKEWANLVEHNEYDDFISTDEQWQQIKNKVVQDNKQDFEAGNGFLSMKSCRWYDQSGHIIQDWKLTRGFPKVPADCHAGSQARKNGKVIGICKYQCRTETPSSVISSMTNTVVNQPINQLNQAIANLIGDNPFKVYLSAIAQAVVWRAMHEVGGLLGGGNSSIPGSSVHWRSNFNYSRVAKSAQNVNFDNTSVGTLKTDAISVKNALKKINLLKEILQKTYYPRLKQNVELEQQINNLYTSLMSESEAISSTTDRIKKYCPSSTNSVTLPDWAGNIEHWKNWIENDMSRTNPLIVQKIINKIEAAKIKIKQFQTDEQKYELACSKSSLPQCNDDPSVVGTLKQAVTSRNQARTAINNVLKQIGEGTVSSFSNINDALQGAINRIISLANNEYERRGSSLSPDQPTPSHPQPDGSWSGTLWGQLKGNDITSKQTELDDLLNNVNNILNSCI